ncbi:MAG TPA: ABC-2 family transporter protein [bacterium]|nr:ABC-2 family transporter protein [bacterium]
MALGLGRYMRLTGLFMKNCLVREMQFKANFLVRLCTEALWLVMQFIYIGVLYGQTGQIVGWTKWDMVVLVGTNHVITQLFEALFYDNCTKLIDQIRQGDLDFNLIKPINTQFLVSLRYTDYASILNSSLGVAVILYGLHRMGGAVTLSGALLFAGLVVNGILIYYAILFTLSVWTFWIGRSNNLLELYWQFGQFSRYPGDIYPWLLRRLLMTVIPMLVVSNFPAAVLVHKLAGGVALYGFALGLGFLAFTVWIWHRGLKRYRSASS